MESRSRNLHRAGSRAARSVKTGTVATGRSRGGARKSSSTIAVIDIGSNSIRLVVYEGLERSLAPVFNEKVLCGLGRAVQSTGLIAEKDIDKALAALRRFHALCQVMKVGRVFAIATAACRDATNGADFIARAERVCGVPIDVLSGTREAKLAALGVVSGVHQPDGIVGDLGGGSLELSDVRGHRVRTGVTLPLGGLALQDAAQKSIKKAERIVKAEIAKVPQLKQGRGRTFYAVGGTWRALARIHIIQSGYPLHIMHGYSIPAADALYFVRRLRRLVLSNTLADVETVTEARRPLLAYAALVLEYIIRTARPSQVTFSTYGVREGLLFEMLSPQERTEDGLLTTARAMNQLRSRAPRHAFDLIDWTDRFMRTAKLRETAQDRRLRHAACLLSDIGWRAHPDYRGEQTLHIITNGNFGAISHQERVFLALVLYYRYAGLGAKNEPPEDMCALLPHAMVERARLIGATFRVAFLVSAAQPGILPASRFRSRARKLFLVLDRKIANIAADRVSNRFKQLVKLIGRSGTIETD